jgi:hypothetical protein
MKDLSENSNEIKFNKTWNKDNKQGAIRFISPANFEDESKWDVYYDWYVSNMEKLRSAMDPYLADLRDV